MIIKVDDREPSQMLEKMENMGMEFERVRMKCGDYVCGDICIERKTCDDLAGSICDGRLKKQVLRMKENYGKCFILVSGRLCDVRSKIHVNSMLGTIVSIIVKHQVPIIMIDNDDELCWVMKRIFERCFDE
jgi:ERCC4-type nuclease